jgi:hypothetical protein
VAGYIWIEGGHHITHITDERHTFDIRDLQNKFVFSITLRDPEEEL